MSELKSIHIIWDDITFGQDEIEFKAQRLNTILKPVKVKGLIKSLNMVRGEYFDRLYGKKAFKLAFSNGELIQNSEASPGMESITGCY